MRPITSPGHAAVAIDDWKLEVFKKHLDDAGYRYEQLPGLTAGTIILKVSYDRIKDLAPVVKAANDEARRSKMQ